MRSIIDGGTALIPICEKAPVGRWPKEQLEWTPGSTASLKAGVIRCQESYDAFYEHIASRVASKREELRRIVDAVEKDVAANLGYYLPHVVPDHRGISFGCAAAVVMATEECPRLAVPE